jgi:predicted transcriptional regulator
MSTLTIRLPDDKHARLKALAEKRNISVNKLIDELATVALANHDARLRFDARVRKGSAKRALALIDRLGED